MNYVILFGSMFVFVAFISWRWVKLIDYMKEKHPDYKGNILFDGKKYDFVGYITN